MLELDGSAGGGQLLRTALSLASITGRGFVMDGIRETRPTPGLRPQHLAAVRVLAEITGATVSGAEEGSATLEFDPGPVESGRYEVDVGTAGSLPLLFDAILPVGSVLEEPLSVSATGGTDVRWAPCLDYLRHVKLPLLRRHGLPARVKVTRRGFYPAGGGVATLSMGPAALRPLELDPPGQVEGARVYSVSSLDLADRDVAERQANSAMDRLGDRGVEITERIIEVTAADSTGSAIVVALDRARTPTGGDALGERGLPAEQVGERAVEPVAELLESGASVDGYLADQLQVYLALAGGSVTTPRRTDHLETNRAVLSRFGFEVSIEERGGLVRLVA